MKNCFFSGLQLALILVLARPGLASAGSAEVAGDPDAGQSVYARCMACHSLSRNRTGPKHCGLFGRRAGSLKGFEYSEAMRKSNIVWAPNTLDAFLKSPFETIPGTTMGYGGVWNKKERADLIAYLQLASQSAECGISYIF